MRQTYVSPRLVSHGNVVEMTAQLGPGANADYIFNNTEETQFGIEPGQTVPGNGGSQNVIINPLP